MAKEPGQKRSARPCKNQGARPGDNYLLDLELKKSRWLWAVGTRGERQHLSKKKSARACAVWCKSLVCLLFVLEHIAASYDTRRLVVARYTDQC